MNLWLKIQRILEVESFDSFVLLWLDVLFYGIFRCFQQKNAKWAETQKISKKKYSLMVFYSKTLFFFCWNVCLNQAKMCTPNQPKILLSLETNVPIVHISHKKYRLIKTFCKIFYEAKLLCFLFLPQRRQRIQWIFEDSRYLKDSNKNFKDSLNFPQV